MATCEKWLRILYRYSWMSAFRCVVGNYELAKYDEISKKSYNRQAVHVSVVCRRRGRLRFPRVVVTHRIDLCARCATAACGYLFNLILNASVHNVHM